jgi:hypothetical protein
MFTEADTWHGGAIELLCLFRRAPSKLMPKIREVVWIWNCLDGPYAKRDIEPSQQAKVSPTCDEAENGVATLPGLMGQTAFYCNFVEDSDGIWLYAGLPLGGLARILPLGGFPFFETKTHDWEHVVYGWLFSLAEHINNRIPFASGAIGWGMPAAIDAVETGVVPQTREGAFITNGGEQLMYHPPNRWPQLKH